MVAAVSVAYARTSIPTPNEMVSAQTTIVYFDDGKSEIGRFGSQNRINVDIDQVPDYVQKAVIAAEDRSFYENRGVSPTGIARAFWNNIRTGSTQGGSTITQQYAKNAYLTQERTYKRKLKEFFIAVKLDRRDDKDKILQDYLNTIYFGRGAYGIQTASQTYFGKDVSKLTVAEGAVLASVIRSPAGYDPDKHADRLEGRFNYVLDGMVSEGWLSAADRAGLQVPKTVTKAKPKGGTNFFLLDTVRKELKAKGFTDAEIDIGGFRVITTFDRKSQRGGRARGAAGAPDHQREEGAHRPVRRRTGHRQGHRDVRRRDGGQSQRGDPGAHPARLGVQGVRAVGGAQGRHRSQEPVPRQQSVQGPGHGRGGQQRVQPVVRKIRRPRPGDRGLHQHGVRRPGRADGTAEGRRCGSRGRHPRGHAWA